MSDIAKRLELLCRELADIRNNAPAAKRIARTAGITSMQDKQVVGGPEVRLGSPRQQPTLDL